jgi:hypothetical protein
MSIIHKVESGYLQLLRVALLLLATIAIAAVAVLGVQYLQNKDAIAKPIKDDASLELSGFSMPKVRDDGTAPDPAQPVVQDPLLKSFDAALSGFWLAINPEASINHVAVANVFKAAETDPTLGRKFLEQAVSAINNGIKNKKLIAEAKMDQANALGKIYDYLQAEFKRKQEEITAERAHADAEAQASRAQALWALYAAGVLALTFAGIILLVVLLRIERNLRDLPKVSVDPASDLPYPPII